MPDLKEPFTFDKLVTDQQYSKKFIAHCLPGQKQQLSACLHHAPFASADSSIILIGPEGDFTAQEIKRAIENEYLPVALGDTRLRTETAGMVAATLLRLAAA